jgi:hypothetical protein
MNIEQILVADLRTDLKTRKRVAFYGRTGASVRVMFQPEREAAFSCRYPSQADTYLHHIQDRGIPQHDDY